MAEAATNPVPLAERPFQHDRTIAVWLLICCVTVFLMVVLGGVTYEEARLVHALNQEAGSTTRVTLGGEFVTSARQFLRSLG